MKVKVDNVRDDAIFKRIYIYFKACKDIFVSCRLIIGLDGYFLKGKYKGDLLTLVGWDPSDQILPLAYAIIEVENKEKWTWFLDLLIEDLRVMMYVAHAHLCLTNVFLLALCLC